MTGVFYFFKESVATLLYVGFYQAGSSTCMRIGAESSNALASRRPSASGAGACGVKVGTRLPLATACSREYSANTLAA